ncbi:MAG: methylenetetrahydrofolate reductase [Acidobacteriota bacterium]|nr:methylenetetrahydrofolate reductase [Acidobacteriota bacterium]
MSPVDQSTLERTLAAGHRAVAIEMTPPIGPNSGALRHRIETLRGFADAFNVTDNQTAKVHASSLAVSILLRQAGLEPVLQLTCRDRNRLGLQSDLIGAALWGITNVVALSGDHPACGDHAHVLPVSDIDSVNLVRLICVMRDGQRFDSGRLIPKQAPHFFVGAVANPFAPPLDYRPYRLAKKVAAGAQFIQTQLIFNLARFREYMSRVVDMGLHEQVAILAGIGLVPSYDLARHLRENVAGIDLPDDVLDRLTGLSREDQAKAGFDLAIEIAEQALQIEGVRGIHIMPMSTSDRVPEMVRALGLYPRPLSGSE